MGNPVFNHLNCEVAGRVCSAIEMHSQFGVAKINDLAVHYSRVGGNDFCPRSCLVGPTFE